MSERMSDEAFAAEVDTLDKEGRYARAMMVAMREAMRARAEEARLLEEAKKKDERIAALEEVLGEAATECGAIAVVLL